MAAEEDNVTVVRRLVLKKMKETTSREAFKRIGDAALDIFATLWKIDPEFFKPEAPKGKELLSEFAVSDRTDPLLVSMWRKLLIHFDESFQKMFPERLRALTADEEEVYSTVIPVLKEVSRDFEKIKDVDVHKVLVLFLAFMDVWRQGTHIFDLENSYPLTARFSIEFGAALTVLEDRLSVLGVIVPIVQHLKENFPGCQFSVDAEQWVEIHPGQRELRAARKRMKSLLSFGGVVVSSMDPRDPYNNILQAIFSSCADLMNKLIAQHPSLMLVLQTYFHRQTEHSSDSIDGILQHLHSTGAFDNVHGAKKKAAERQMTQDDWEKARDKLTEELRKANNFAEFVERCQKESCSTCMENPMSSFYESCGHVFMCSECFRGETANNMSGVCPLCRVESANVLWFP